MAKFAVLSVSMLCLIFLFSGVTATPLLSPEEAGFGGQTRSQNFDALVDAFFSDGDVVTVIEDRFLWVPWFKTSSSSEPADLQDGRNCDSGQAIDLSHNCMVTDEFSQLGILIAMGDEQQRMDDYFNTILASKSAYGNLPAWRIYRDGNTIEPCRPGINGNCDTASDADARVIIALYTAANNPRFGDPEKKAGYASLARSLSVDLLHYETDRTCRTTAQGEICNWLAAGSNAKSGGIGSTDFAYTGYFPDAIIAMLAAYADSDNPVYLEAAKDFTLNYLQAAKFDGQALTVPPGKAFRWVIEDGEPKAECTNTCGVWDAFDASRALGMCQAEYYASIMGVELPGLKRYCELLTERHMGDATSCPVQFFPDGSAGAGPQSGVFAQGLQALHFSGAKPELFRLSLDSALSHYSPQTQTFDYAPSIGIYTQAIAARALGMGIGRDMGAFGIPPVGMPTGQAAPLPRKSIADLSASCTFGPGQENAAPTLDSASGGCRTIEFGTPAGTIRVFACEKEGGYVEIYTLAAPAGLEFKACISDGCVAKDNGFARFTPGQARDQARKTVDTPAAGIAGLPVTCASGDARAGVKSDVMSGACRTIVFQTHKGEVKVMACEKSGGTFEVYRQEFPEGSSYRACIGEACIDKDWGFASATL